MSQRSFHFRLQSQPGVSGPASASVQLERQDETGRWEPLQPQLDTPPFRMFLVSLLLCLHFHLVAEARERGVSPEAVVAEFSATTDADWSLTQLQGTLRVRGVHCGDGEIISEAELIERIQARMRGCPVMRNLDPAIPRTLTLHLDLPTHP